MSDWKRVWINGGWKLMGPAGYAGLVVERPEGRGEVQLGAREVVESDQGEQYIPGLAVYGIVRETYFGAADKGKD